MQAESEVNPAPAADAPASDAEDENQRLLKEIYAFECPWNAYSLAWSNRSDQLFRMAVGSYMDEYANEVQLVQLVQLEDGLGLEARGSFEHPYPPTKIQWYPSSNTSAPDLLATTGDYLRLWEVSQGSEGGASKVELRSFLNNNRKTDFCAPLTSFDWNREDPRILATCSVDTTVRVWDLEKEKTTTQLIAHEKEVYDIGFARGNNVFATVGGDGSVRLFDLRALEHSNILFEGDQPLLRVGWNSVDSNFVACFGSDSRTFVIIDIRFPSTPIAARANHNGPVNAIAWPPHSATHIASASEDSHVLIWDVAPMPTMSVEPILAYAAPSAISNLSWSGLHSEWIGIVSGKHLQALRV